MKINETIVTTQNHEGQVHITPFGVREQGGHILIAPFKPSTTLQNILDTKAAVVNLTDDVRVFAGALTKQLCCEITAAEKISGARLVDTLAHMELELIEIKEDEQRPTLIMRLVHEVNHRPFKGFNRAQAAVIELAVLVSRLNMLPKDKIMQEKDYLQIAIDKTAGDAELEAWGWLNQHIDQFYAMQTGEHLA